MNVRRGLKYLGIAVLVVGLLVAAGFLTGILGVPTVESVENRFASVNDSTTTVDTALTVHNPNPVGASLGDLSVDYAIAMNDVPMANGSKEGVSVGSGHSTLEFTSYLRNGNIPEWWYTHVANGETTQVVVDATLSHGLAGDRSLSIPQRQTVQTDILGQFNDTTTRPVNASAPLVSDPVLYLNETSATYGSPLTREQTPLDMAFTVYNPKAFPYTVTEVGYEIRMNGVAVGEGSSRREYVIPPGGTETIETTTVIKNGNLDDWWVSHLQRDQVTTLYVDFYFVVDPGPTEPIRIDSEKLDYETTIETDIFGTKASDGLEPGTNETSSGDGSAGDGSDGTATPSSDGTGSSSETPTATSTPEPTPTPTPEPTEDDGLL